MAGIGQCGGGGTSGAVDAAAGDNIHIKEIVQKIGNRLQGFVKGRTEREVREPKNLEVDGYGVGINRWRARRFDLALDGGPK